MSSVDCGALLVPRCVLLFAVCRCSVFVVGCLLVAVVIWLLLCVLRLFVGRCVPPLLDVVVVGGVGVGAVGAVRCRVLSLMCVACSLHVRCLLCVC